MSKFAASDKWYFSFLPAGIANGSTSLLIALFAKELGANVGQVGLIAAASSLASVPAYMLWGNLSDRMKRRKIFVMAGFLGMAVCLFLMGISSDIPNYFIANLLFGFLSAASAPVATVLVIEMAAQENWAKRIALFSQVGGTGWVAGLALGAIWLQFGFFNTTLNEDMRILFMMGTGLSLLSVLLAWKWIQEPENKISDRPLHPPEHHFITVERLKYIPQRMVHVFYLRAYIRHPHKFNRTLHAYLLCIFLLFAGFTAFYAFFPIFLIEEVGLPSSHIFLVYIASQFTSVISYTKVGRWVIQKGSKKTQLLGSVARAILFPSFLAVALLDLPIIATLAIIIVLHAMVGLCWALINVSGSMIVSNLAPENVRGHAFGAYNAMQGFGSIGGPVIGGLVCQFFGYPAGFLCASGFVLAGIVVLLRLKAV